MGFPWDVLAFGADVALAMMFYQAYKNNAKLEEAAKNAPYFETSTELLQALDTSPDKTLNYAGFEGVVKELENPLRSSFGSTQGVIQNLSIVEHKSKRTQGYWSDLTKTIKDNTNVIPFALNMKSSTHGDVLVKVHEPLHADMLMDSLYVVHDFYEPVKSSMLEKGIDRLFGEVSQGFQEKESMLEIGANMVGIGKLVLDNRGINLLPPEESGGSYILTKLTRREILKQLKSNASTMKLWTFIFGITGTAILAYILYKWFKEWSDLAEIRSITERIRENRNRNQSDNEHDDDNNTNGESDKCVICLTNPRELVLLECGHICLCAECYPKLPQPRKCPVCRGNVKRAVPTYNA